MCSQFPTDGLAFLRPRYTPSVFPYSLPPSRCFPLFVVDAGFPPALLSLALPLIEGNSRPLVAQ